MGNGESTLRVKVPCADEGEFYARLADRIAENGLRVPTAAPPAIGARARVGLEFRDGAILSGDAVVEEHLEVDGRPGVKVRILKLDGEALDVAVDGDEPLSPARARRAAPGRPDAALAEQLFADLGGDARTGALSFTVSTEIAAAVAQRTARYQRAAAIVAAVAVAIAIGVFAVARFWGGPATPEEAVAAHVKAADRLLAEGKLTGKDGALDHLLAAKRLRPGDAATTGRLDRVADMLERLAAGALERGDLPVAAIHLASARAAAPDRASLRAKQDALDRRLRARASR
jgi:hypothetical protein